MVVLVVLGIPFLLLAGMLAFLLLELPGLIREAWRFMLRPGLWDDLKSGWIGPKRPPPGDFYPPPGFWGKISINDDEKT